MSTRGKAEVMRRVTCAVALMILCGCNNGGSTNDLALGTTVPETVPTTVAAPTTTTTIAAAPTELPTTAPAPTDAPTTLATEPAATAPRVSKEDQVRADFLAAREVRQNCSYEPLACHFESIAIPGSPMDLATRKEVADAIANNVAAKRGFGDVTVRVEGIGFEGHAAFVTACAFDTGVLFDLADPANPDDDNVVDDSVASYRVRWELRQLNGGWLIFDNKGLEQLTAGDLCGF
jgi:hypothetical protein